MLDDVPQSDTHSAPRVFAETARALAAPRRALPMALVALSLVATELVAGGSAQDVFVDLTLIGAFSLLSPTSYRVLLSRPGANALGWVAFVALALVVVALLGVLVPVALDLGFTYLTDPRAVGVVVVLFVVGGWGLGRDIDLELGLERERARGERLERQTQSAQLLALRAQLDPHFLFNTLNAIAEWCREDPLVAERATLQLSAMLRTIFDAVRAPRWSLASELSLLRELGALYAARDAERYVFEHLPAQVADAPDVDLPALLLLPLFENAIKHGAAAGHAGVTRVEVRAEAERVRVRIANPGAMGQRRAGGEGIAMVERRLELAYGADASMRFESSSQETQVVVELPLGGPAPKEGA